MNLIKTQCIKFSKSEEIYVIFSETSQRTNTTIFKTEINEELCTLRLSTCTTNAKINCWHEAGWIPAVPLDKNVTCPALANC